MSQVLINQYLADLDRLKKVGGTHRESVVREAFKDLLKGWGKQHDLVFIPEYKLDSATRDTRFVDGALLHELRVPFGYWEAKDAKDDLDAEIEFKFKRGYPQDNIIFEDSTQAVLIQRREEVMRCGVGAKRSLGLRARKQLSNRLVARPAQGEEAQGPDHLYKVRYLPLCPSQMEGGQPADARDHGQRKDGADRGGDEDWSTLMDLDRGPTEWDSTAAGFSSQA